MGKKTSKSKGKPKQSNPGGIKTYKPKSKFSVDSKVTKEKKINPFEFKFNRNKHEVIGSKKSAVGAPGLNKKRAQEIREKNLGAHLDRLGKTNVIKDKRLGQNDASLTEDQKAELRFKFQREKFFTEKTSKYTLDGVPAEELTHKGSKLTNIQKYEKLQGDDDDGDLDPAVFAEANFGGGEFDSANLIPLGERQKTRREVLQEVITKSKAIKYEKQKEKEDMADQTKELDNLLNTLRSEGKLGSLVIKKEGDQEAPVEQTKTDESYEAIFKELKMDGGKMAIAEKGVKINEDRKRKLKFIPDDDETKKAKEPEQEEFELVFDEQGKPINMPKNEKFSITKLRAGSVSESEDSEDNDDSDDDINQMIQDDDLDGNCMLDEDEEDADEEEEESDEGEDDDTIDQDDTVAEQPSTDVPSTYEQLKEVLEALPASESIFDYVSNIAKVYHPSKKEGNKGKLGRLFVFLLRICDETFSKETASIQQIPVFSKSLYILMKFDPDFALRCIKAILKKKYTKRHDGNLGSPITLDLVVLFKVISDLFVTDTYLHLIGTAATLALTEAITNVHVKCAEDAAKSNLLISMFIGCFEKNEFYNPEIMAHLQGLLMLCVDNGEKENFPTIQFPLVQPYRTCLVVKEEVKNVNYSPISLTKLFNGGYDENEASLTLSVINSILVNVQYFAVAYTDMACAYTAIFKPIVALIKRLPTSNYPQSLSKVASDLCRLVESNCAKYSTLERLGKPQSEVKMLKMLEPEFDTHFNPERKKFGKDQAGVTKQLQQKLKQETKGAIKELRKDAQFIAQKKRSQMAAINQERIDKTATIVKQLRGQESEAKEKNYKK
uniref:Nucleolar protein 14 n=1 Tax=Rhabditophanes sp. KR3021 TaxID=114890 RepID=A0AC35TJ09_9BILA